jgi:hypothetical protein
MKMFNCNKIQKGAMKSCNKILKNLGNSKLYTVYMINKFKYRISLVSKLSLIYIRWNIAKVVVKHQSINLIYIRIYISVTDIR